MRLSHAIVYAEHGMYAGWPANHGAWQRGDEFLVGFLRGKYKSKSMHNIAEPFEKVLARSQDGGRTWSVEVPGVDFECIAPTAPPPLNLHDSIIRVCGVYDHGGDICFEQGGFYASDDFGRTWHGPYLFAGLEEQFSGDLICTARTRVQGDLVFLSAGQSKIWGTDHTFCVTHDGTRFQFRSVVLEDNARAVMPAVARTGDRLVGVLRRRKTGKRAGWIDAVKSDDDGASWQPLSWVGDAGGNNGNPPALVALPDGRLCCVFGNRDFGSIVCALSADRGETWETSIVRDGGGEAFLDIGYPQLFLRSDGVPVCVYYWADLDRPQQHIVATSMENLIS